MKLDIYGYPNQECYPNQKISVGQVEAYVYLVPYIENNEVSTKLRVKEFHLVLQMF